MTVINIQLYLHSFIADPYWPEMEQLINITKLSGASRARSEENKRKALTEHLEKLQMTYSDYEQLVERARRPWHLDSDGTIKIPKLNVDGMLVECCTKIRAASRPCLPEQVRTVLRASDFHTNMVPEDAHLWQRFVVLKSGTLKLSNQRTLAESWFVGDQPPADVEPTGKVFASGTIEINPEMVKPDTLRNALRWAGQWVGIGASRKMGWGRFTVEDWEVVS